MKLLFRKMVRDLWQKRGLSLAVLVVTAVGVMLFVTSAAAYRDLSDSYAATRTRLGLAPLHVAVTSTAPDDVARLARQPEIAHVESREVAELMVAPKSADQRIELRVLSLPDQGEPELDRVLVLEGKAPEAGEVLLETHFAKHHGLGAGSTLHLASGKEARVAGVGVSAEYLWVARDENDFMPTPAEFGVGWMRESTLRSLADGSDLRTELLIRPTEGATRTAVTASVESVVAPDRIARQRWSDELVGVKLLQLDLDGYRSMAAFFPLFFLGVGAFIVGSVLARIVDGERATIGTFLALGTPPSRIALHYVGYAMTLGIAGALLGGAGGLAASPEVTKSYAVELNIPFVEAHLHLELLLWGLAMGAAASALASLSPALRAMRLQPAEAMRAERPSTGPLARLARRLRAPLPIKLALRDVLGRPLRSLGTSLGVAAAVVLVLSTGVLLDSMKMTFSSLFEDARRYDVRADLPGPAPADETLRTVRAQPGVAKAEALLVFPATLHAGDRSSEVLLQALDDDAELLRSVDVDGSPVAPGPNGITLTRATAKHLHLAPGDAVTVEPFGGGPTITVHLTGFADAAMGATANVRRSDVDTAWGLQGMTSTIVVRTQSQDTTQVRADLAKTLPAQTHIEDAAATRSMFQQLMGLGWVMLGVMLLFSSVLAAAILFNTATLSVMERQRELATLRALGLTMREVTGVVTLEHALLVVLGLAMGLPAAIVAAKRILGMFSGELFSLPFVLAPSTVAITFGATVVFVLLAQWPALRNVARANLADAVRVREG